MTKLVVLEVLSKKRSGKIDCEECLSGAGIVIEAGNFKDKWLIPFQQEHMK